MSGVLNHNRIVFLWLNGFELSPQTLVAKCPNHFQIAGKRHSLDLRELAYTKSMKGNNFKKTMRRLVIVICTWVLLFSLAYVTAIFPQRDPTYCYGNR